MHYPEGLAGNCISTSRHTRSDMQSHALRMRHRDRDYAYAYACGGLCIRICVRPRHPWVAPPLHSQPHPLCAARTTPARIGGGGAAVHLGGGSDARRLPILSPSRDPGPSTDPSIAPSDPQPVCRLAGPARCPRAPRPRAPRDPQPVLGPRPPPAYTSGNAHTRASKPVHVSKSTSAHGHAPGIPGTGPRERSLSHHTKVPQPRPHHAGSAGPRPVNRGPIRAGPGPPSPTASRPHSPAPTLRHSARAAPGR